MRVNKGAIALIMLLFTLSSAQNDEGKSPNKVKPHFTGTWVLDESRSSSDRTISDYLLTIDHREPSIRMTKQYKRGTKRITEEIEYRTDGKAEFNPSRRPGDPSPETKWRGAKLVRRSVSRPAGSGSLNLEFVTHEEWSLSDDQQILARSIELTMGSSRIDKTIMVFKRRQ